MDITLFRIQAIILTSSWRFERVPQPAERRFATKTAGLRRLVGLRWTISVSGSSLSFFLRKWVSNCPAVSCRVDCRASHFRGVHLWCARKRRAVTHLLRHCAAAHGLRLCTLHAVNEDTKRGLLTKSWVSVHSQTS